MIGAAVGAGLSAVSSIVGGAISRANARKAKGVLDTEKANNESWYSRRANEDYTQSAEAQRSLNLAREAAMQQLQNARGAQTVMGGTEESVAQAQNSASNMISDTVGGIAAQGTARRDAVESDYLQRRGAIANQYYNLYGQRSQNAATQASSASQGFTNFGVADLNAHLKTGKGLFGDQFNFGKSKGNTTFDVDTYNKGRFRI